jgi:hypothetical protein
MRLNKIRTNRISILTLAPLGLAFLLSACFMPIPQVPNTASGDTARVPYFTATSSPTPPPTPQPTAESYVSTGGDVDVEPKVTATLNVWVIGSPTPIDPYVASAASGTPSASATAVVPTVTAIASAATATPSPTATPRPPRPSPTATIEAQATLVAVPTVDSTPDLAADLNLRPKAPGGWGAPLLVANESGIQKNTDLYEDEQVFVSWAITNEGPADVQSLFFVDLTLDGVMLDRWRNNQLPEGFIGSAPDWSQLLEKVHPDAGPHTIGIVVDPTNLLPESDETDNTYEQEFTWLPSRSSAEPTQVPNRLPDLQPKASDGWGTALIATSYQGDSEVGPVSVDSTTYVKLGMENRGLVSVGDDVSVHLLLDGMTVRELTWSGLVSGQTVKSSEWDDLLSMVSLTEGAHTLTMVIDPHNAIRESNEDNNTLELELEWATGAVEPKAVYDAAYLLPSPSFLPNLSPGWIFSYDGPIVVSNERLKGVNSLLTVDETSYVDVSVMNRSVHDVPGSFDVELYFDGFLVKVFRITGGVAPSQIAQISDWDDLNNQFSIMPGEHTLRMVIDPTDEIWEEREDDNVYETTFFWTSGEPDVPEPIEYWDYELEAMLSDFDALMDSEQLVVDDDGPALIEDALRLADAGYFLATGDSLLDTRVDFYLLSHEDYVAWVDYSYSERFAVVEEEKYQDLYDERETFKKTTGFKGRRFGKVAIVVDAENTMSVVMATLAHELGHLRQDMVNPLQSEIEQFYSVNAIQEAQAQQFERVFWLHMEDFIGSPLLQYPDHQGFRSYIDSHIGSWLEDVDADVHNLGFLLQWLVILDDPELIQLRGELESTGQLSIESSGELFNYMVNLPSSSMVTYADERLISLETHRDTILALAKSRLIEGLHPDSEGRGALITPGLLAP